MLRNKALRLGRGCWFFYTFSLKLYYKFPYNSFFSLSSTEGLLHYIAPLGHLDPTLVIHLSPYLSARPIRHLLWLFVSCVRRGNTVQRSSPHKCSQKSSCNTFNVVVATFPLDIFEFTSFLHVYETCSYYGSFMKGCLSSWSMRLSGFFISKEEPLLGLHSVHPSFECLSVGGPDKVLLLLERFSYFGQRPKAERVILGLYPYKTHPANLQFIQDTR